MCSKYALNAICPYYAMFPLEFPMRILQNVPRDYVVADPFCGRGTTNFAAQMLGMRSYGIDTSPVAIAIARSKCSNADIGEVLDLAKNLINSAPPKEIPKGVFWKHAFHPSTLKQVCGLREGLQRKSSQTAILLRALALGCLHGPRNKTIDTLAYFSNQMPRTFASKPDYAVRFWTKNGMVPPKVDVISVLKRKGNRSLGNLVDAPGAPRNIKQGDASKRCSFKHITEDIDIVVTSPPYYGLQTYVEDQWLRNWFVGGPPNVPYGAKTGLKQTTQSDFATALGRVWVQLASKSSVDARLVIRFGSVGSRDVDAKGLLKESLRISDKWRVYRTVPIQHASESRRQATAMGTQSQPLAEYDFFCARK